MIALIMQGLIEPFVLICFFLFARGFIFYEVETLSLSVMGFKCFFQTFLPNCLVEDSEPNPSILGIYIS